MPLRPSYAQLGKKALRLASRYAHARQMQRASREIRRLKTYLGRVFRDVPRKLGGRPEVAGHFAAARPGRAVADAAAHRQAQALRPARSRGRLHRQGQSTREVRVRRKVSVALTNREGLVVGMHVHAGNPYDGQTLAPALVQVERLTGVTPERCYVDRG